jgi:hypothetical protein|tara:strand:+ start:136 stop:546 length:411 start_codon:yes stop_codon:yes gene_type:complete
MELKARKLVDKDYDILTTWWNKWPGWSAPSKDFLPNNGTGGLIIEKDNTPIVAGFMYMTNSKALLLEWIVSNPDYKEDDRGDAIELLITAAETISKDLGYKYMFTIGRNSKLIDTHKKLGWKVDDKPSHEIVKIIN